MAKQPGISQKPLRRLPYVVAVLVLAVCAFGISPMLDVSSGKLDKDPLPLRQELGKLAKTLGPYRFHDLTRLPASMVEALGTDMYIEWRFVDTKVADRSDPLRWVKLFVTYYTGGRNLVPHVAEECRAGAGYKPTETANLDLDIPSLGGSVPVRVLSFRKNSQFKEDNPTVIYTFHCNGEFTSDRNTVRYRTNSLSETYAYFCKIELSFGSALSRPADASREDSVQAAQEFLDYLLPELLDRHLPDWEAANRAPEAQEAVEATAS